MSPWQRHLWEENESLRKNPNVMPVLYTMNSPDGPRDTILLQAIKDVPVNQELLWDYGVRRHSFGGEGLDFDWLDQ